MQISSVSLINKIQNSVPMRGTGNIKPATVPIEERSQSGKDFYLDYADNQGKLYRTMVTLTPASLIKEAQEAETFEEKTEKAEKAAKPERLPYENPYKTFDSLIGLTGHAIKESNAEMFTNKVLQYLQNTGRRRDKDNEIIVYSDKMDFKAKYSDETSKFPHTVEIERSLNGKGGNQKKAIEMKFDEDGNYKTINSSVLKLEWGDYDDGSRYKYYPIEGCTKIITNPKYQAE